MNVETEKRGPAASGARPEATAASADEAYLVDPDDKKAVRQSILRLAGPSLVEMMLTNFTQMLSMIMVGRLSPEAVATVGLTNQPFFLLLAIFMTLNVGTTVIVARSVGAGKLDEANRAAGQAFLINIALSVVTMAFSTIYAAQLLRLMGGTEEVVAHGLTYAKIVFLSIGFTTITMSFSATMRGAGDTRTPMKINVIANILVVVIGFPLIYGIGSFEGLGLTGAGLATIASQFVAAVWMTAVMFGGKSQVRLSFRHMFRFDREIVARICKIGFPSAVEQIVMRLGMLIFVKVAASLGTMAVAATQIAFSIFGLTFMPGMAFAIAASTLVGQALGAQKPDLAERYGWQVRKIGMYVAGLLGVGFILFAPQIMLLYTTEPEIIDKGALSIRIMGFIQVSQATQFILGGALRGAGDTRYPLYSTFVGVWGFRVALSLLFVYAFRMDLYGIWLAAAADQFVRSVLIFRRFKKGAWKTIRV
ncbi:MATE family efflux transporter [Paenibacillus flagellatus]|uniref:Probable multidrug resistance protein NorM n=1 Tax=Paenibacillus flagellatus TaxID=2211139 RepID=A0A2V5KG20_9BACL|nr:MATE family efflux transporter [Paenibacillus flagellatus]PYI57534.1 MATE family efflux transporter [Paenibacillus flagellatus]